MDDLRNLKGLIPIIGGVYGMLLAGGVTDVARMTKASATVSASMSRNASSQTGFMNSLWHEWAVEVN